MKPSRHRQNPLKPSCVGSAAQCLWWLLVVLPFGVCADFNYKTNNNELTIIWYSGLVGTVVVPDSVNGLPVTRIGDGAFKGRGDLHSITLGTNVLSIGDEAFKGCTGLYEIRMDEALTQVGDSAFAGCTALPGVTIPERVARIGNWAFQGCGAMFIGVQVPASVTRIGDGAFGGCRALPWIVVDAANPAYTSVDGVLYDKARTTLVSLPSGRAGSYSVPDGVVTIGNGALAGCTGLTNVGIPDGVIRVGHYAFSDCAGLQRVTVGRNVSSLGWGAFSGCVQLERITLPDTATNLGNGVFMGCRALAEVTLPRTLTLIPDDLFNDCRTLGQIDIPDSVTSISSSAFSFCTRLTTVRIPGGVTSISSSLFWGCTNLTEITIPDGVTLIGGSAFRDCSGLSSLTIPEKVAFIADMAFAGCSGLEAVVIPGSVASLGKRVFNGCPKLREISVAPGNPKFSSIDGVLFGSLDDGVLVRPGAVLLRCPEGRVGRYRIPSGVQRVEAGAFANCAGLTSITVPMGVAEFGAGVFSVTGSGLTSLKELYFEGDAPAGPVASASTLLGPDRTVKLYRMPGSTGWNGFSYLGPTLTFDRRIEPESLRVKAGSFGFNVIGTSGQSFEVEACSDLAQPDWTRITPNLVDGSSVEVSDPQWTNSSSRFYRVRMP